MGLVRDLRWESRSQALLTSPVPEYDLLHGSALPCPSQSANNAGGGCNPFIPRGQRVVTLWNDADAVEIRLSLPLNESAAAVGLAVLAPESASGECCARACVCLPACLPACLPDCLTD